MGFAQDFRNTVGKAALFENRFEVFVLEFRGRHSAKPVSGIAHQVVAHFAEGNSISECVHWANIAAALSTLQLGAQAGLPHHGDVQNARAKMTASQA